MTPIIPPYLEPQPGYYSPHFSKVEMCSSETAARRGIDNTPPAHLEANLVRLCQDFLEPIRSEFGPIHITSAYRCWALNTAIGGSQTSAHPDGRAVDFKPVRPLSLQEVVERIIASQLPYDQLIYEFGAWVHIGIARAGQVPRGEALMIFAGAGYSPFDPRKFPTQGATP